MLFNPKFPTVRAMRAAAAVLFLVIGLVAVRVGNIRSGWCLIGVSLGVVIGLFPESPAKKPQPEKYHITT